MTSKEILQASLLEIVFDNRNKQYGAYTLRKFYENRLAVALGIALSAVFLFCLLMVNAGTSKNVIEDLTRPPVETEFIIPPDAARPKAAAAKAAAASRKTETLTTPVIVDADKVDIKMPTTSELEQTSMPNTGSEGGNGDPKPGSTGVTTGGENEGNGEKEKENAFIPESVQPEFPGGAAAWMAFLSKWLQVPEDMQPGERKTVLVSFQVGEDGSVTNFQIVRSAGKAFDNEVLRAMKRMPKWRPAIQNGRKVATSFSQPVTFQSYEN